MPINITCYDAWGNVVSSKTWPGSSNSGFSSGTKGRNPAQLTQNILGSVAGSAYGNNNAWSGNSSANNNVWSGNSAANSNVWSGNSAANSNVWSGNSAANSNVWSGNSAANSQKKPAVTATYNSPVKYISDGPRAQAGNDAANAAPTRRRRRNKTQSYADMSGYGANAPSRNRRKGRKRSANRHAEMNVYGAESNGRARRKRGANAAPKVDYAANAAARW